MQIHSLLKQYRSNHPASKPARILFHGVADKDVYNITAPFNVDKKTYLFGRVESRDSEFSQACLFEEKENEYYLVEEFPHFDMQDPFITFIQDEIVLGGVVINESKTDPNVLEWRTDFFKGTTLDSLEKFFEGPKGMKDIRLKELSDNRILVLTRPQGKKGGRGKIGATIIDSLNSLTIDLVEDAPLLNHQFTDEEWGGANEIHLIDQDTVGVLGHIASFDDEDNRHYYALSFRLDLNDFSINSPIIIAERRDFLEGPSKRDDLIDVVFSGGILQLGNAAELYCGISDAEAQKIMIENPFMKEG